MSPTAVSPEPEAQLKSDSAPRSAFEIREEPIHTRRPLRVACLGAGYSGILLGIIWNQRMQNRNASLVIYERNSDLGGTWLENRCELHASFNRD